LGTTRVFDPQIFLQGRSPDQQMAFVLGAFCCLAISALAGTTTRHRASIFAELTRSGRLGFCLLAITVIQAVALLVVSTPLLPRVAISVSALLMTGVVSGLIMSVEILTPRSDWDPATEVATITPDQ
jgi:hypothetical protein